MSNRRPSAANDARRGYRAEWLAVNPIRTRREAAELTREHAADLWRVSAETLANLETGRCNASDKMVRKLAAAMGIDATGLLLALFNWSECRPKGPDADAES